MSPIARRVSSSYLPGEAEKQREAISSCAGSFLVCCGGPFQVQRQVSTTRRGLAGVFRSSKSQKEQREAEAIAAQAAAAAAAVMAVATVEVKSVAPDGTVVSLCSSIQTNRKEPVRSKLQTIILEPCMVNPVLIVAVHGPVPALRGLSSCP